MKRGATVTLLITLTLSIKGQTKDLECREILDTAFFRVLYKFELSTLKEKEPHIVIDTMALDVGDTWSKYFNQHRFERYSTNLHNRLNDSYPLLWRRFDTNEEELQKRLESKQDIIDLIDWRKEGESSIIYKNRQKDEIMTIDEGPMEGVNTHTLFRFTESVTPQDWVILEDTMTVLGYLCQKATTYFWGRNYIAWFTLEVPVPEGPWKLYGLPGLILKAEDNDTIFRMEAVGLEKTENDIDLVWEETWDSRGSDIRVVKKFIEGNIAQWHAYRKQRFGKISMSFLAGDHIRYYSITNPIEYPEFEIIE